MTVAVFGASGNVGHLVVEELVRRGHKVIVFIHTTPGHAAANVHQVTGDIHSSRDVLAALEAEPCQAVISTLGSWKTSAKDIVAVGTQHILAAMAEQGIPRFVGLTGTAALLKTDRPRRSERITRWVFGWLAPRILHDAERALRVAAGSTLRWTFIRAPRISQSAQAAYTLRLTGPAPWQSVSRIAVARALVDVMEQGSFIGQAPFIHPAKT